MKKYLLIIVLFLAPVLITGFPDEICYPLNSGAVCINGTHLNNFNYETAGFDPLLYYLKTEIDESQLVQNNSIAGKSAITYCNNSQVLANITATGGVCVDVATPQDLSGALWVNGSRPLTADWAAGAFNISASWFLGRINASNVSNPPWLTSFTESDPIFRANYSDILSQISGRVLNATLADYSTIAYVSNRMLNTTVEGLVGARAKTTYCNGSTVLQNVTGTGGNCLTVLTGESDPVFSAVYADINTSISGRVPNATLTGVLTNISGKAVSTYCNGTNVLQNVTSTGGQCLPIVSSESDPVFSAVYASINTSISGRVPNATLSNFMTNATIETLVSGRVPNATLADYSTIAYVGNRMLNTTVIELVGTRMLNSTVETLVSGRVPNATLADYSTIAYVGNRMLNTTVIANHRLNTNTSFPGNITVVENVTSVKCIVFSNGAKLGVC